MNSPKHPPAAAKLTYESDREILHKQINQVNEFTDNLSKSHVIKDSAILLEQSHKYDADLTVICSKLVKLFKNIISARFIRSELDAKYKDASKANDSKDNTPMDQCHEILFRLNDLAKTMNSIGKNLEKSYAQNKHVRKAVQDSIHNLAQDVLENRQKYLDMFNSICGTSSALTNLLNLIRYYQAEADKCVEMFDLRLGLDIFLKLQIKILLLQSWTYNQLAKRVHYDAKWISKIDRDMKIPKYTTKEKVISETFDFLKNIRHCPNPKCGLDYTELFMSLQKLADQPNPTFGTSSAS